MLKNHLPQVRREGTFFNRGGGGGAGRGILEIFCEKNRGPPTSQNGLRYDPSQKHLTLCWWNFWRV